MVPHTCNSGSWEMEAGTSWVQITLTAQPVWGQTWLDETLPQKNLKIKGFVERALVLHHH